MIPITEVQNRVNCIIQAMCSNKYKTINPDLTLHEFNALEQQRVDRLEDSLLKFKKLSSARIKKGFLMVNQMLTELDNLKQNVELYKDNFSSRKVIISEIQIEPDLAAERDPIEYASPAVPQKSKSKKRKTLSKSKKKSKSPKKYQRSIGTMADDIMSKCFLR